MPAPSRRDVLLLGVAGALLALDIPAWGALLAGMVLALGSSRSPPAWLKTWSPRALQGGVVALGAGMDLRQVLRVGAEGAGLTAASLVLSLGLAWALGRALNFHAVPASQ